MELNKIINGDSMDVLKTFPADFFDSIVVDPPYGIGFMGKEWDTFKSSFVKDNTLAKIGSGSKEARGRNDTSAAWVSAMYDTSRAGNLNFQKWFTDISIELFRVLKPGGYFLSACGTRTQHRMASAMEDAGFEIRDVISWIYGSGFPKSLDFSKDNASSKAEGKRVPLPQFVGADFEKGYGTALKPATELFTMARKPLSEKTVRDNVLKHGTGGINIDASRIALNGEKQPSGSAKRVFSNNGFNEDNTKYGDNKTTPEGGRFPANVIFDEYTGKLLDEQTGVLKSGNSNGFVGKYKAQVYGKYANNVINPETIYADQGGASRFFYCAKASKSERNMGLDGFEKKVGGMRSDTSGQHITRRDGGAPGLVANHHPTVKPLKLMRYLVKMVTPPNGTVLDCFGGSGTTGVACKMDGFNYVLIEREKEYCNIAESRIKSVIKNQQEE